LPETLADTHEIFAEDDAIAELSGSMYDMVNELPSPYREALLMTEYQGLTQQDLAQQMGISLSGAKSRVQRVRQKIKDSLLACCHFEFDRYGRVVDYWEACCCCSSNHC
jgi:RNA polymerase sigma-70 factor (ECF subfamily)